jgi:uncharacterized protein YukE
LVISLVVDGSPAGCRAAARELRALRNRVESAAETLAQVVVRSGGAWTGHAGDAFRAEVKALLLEADELAAVLARLAPGLVAVADRLDGVRGDMATARAIAAEAGIPVTHDGLPHAADVPPGQQAAHSRAVAVVTRARDREAALQRDWAALLAEVLPEDPVPSGPTRRLSGGPLESLGDLARERSLPDLVGDVDLPDLPRVDLEDVPAPGLPLLPPLRVPGVTRGGIPLDPRDGLVTGAVKAGVEQFREDADRDDLSLADRVARAVTMGLTTTGGAVAGVGLCARIGVARTLVPLCGTVGKAAGERLGEKLLEVSDGRR